MSPKIVDGKLSNEVVEFLSRRPTPHYVNQLCLHEELHRKRDRIAASRRRINDSVSNSELSSECRYEIHKCNHKKSGLKLGNTTKTTRRCCGILRSEFAEGEDRKCKKDESKPKEYQKQCKCCACTRCKGRRCMCRRRRARKCSRRRRRSSRRRRRTCRCHRRGCACRKRRRYKRRS